jgi:hypothetical protein
VQDNQLVMQGKKGKESEDLRVKSESNGEAKE